MKTFFVIYNLQTLEINLLFMVTKLHFTNKKLTTKSLISPADRETQFVTFLTKICNRSTETFTIATSVTSEVDRYYYIKVSITFALSKMHYEVSTSRTDNTLHL